DDRGCRQRHAGRPRRASIDRPKERPHAGSRVGEHARALAADRRTARNRFRGGTHDRQGGCTDPGTPIEFARLHSAELISLMLAALAGGALYAIVKAALEKLGAWQAAAPKLAMAAHTRAYQYAAVGKGPLMLRSLVTLHVTILLLASASNTATAARV